MGWGCCVQWIRSFIFRDPCCRYIRSTSGYELSVLFLCVLNVFHVCNLCVSVQWYFRHIHTAYRDNHTHTHTHTHMYIYIYIYIYMCVCVCVCVCVESASVLAWNFLTFKENYTPEVGKNWLQNEEIKFQTLYDSLYFNCFHTFMYDHILILTLHQTHIITFSPTHIYILKHTDAHSLSSIHYL